MLLLLFPSLKGSVLFSLSVLLVWIWVAVLLLAVTRGRLSYQRYLRETALPAPFTEQEQEQGEARASL